MESSCTPRWELEVLSGGAVVPPEQVFDDAALLSDHLPQSSRIRCVGSKATPPPQEVLLEVLTWNLMGRGRAGRLGRRGTALAGRRLSNNGLDCDEGVEAYEERVLARVTPVIAAWMRGDESRRPPCGHKSGRSWPRAACLQEFPALPTLQADILSQLRKEAKRPTLHLAVHFASPRKSVEEVPATPYCNAVVWDADDWERAVPVVEEDQLGLRLVRRRESPTSHGGWPERICIFSLHLPFIDVPGGAMYDKAAAAAQNLLAALPRCFPPTDVVLVAGDFNVDVRDAQVEGWATSCLPDSAIFRGNKLTVDACAAALGCASDPSDQVAAQEDGASARSVGLAGDSVVRVGDSAPFFGSTRDAFVASRVDRALQDDPRLWQLSDLELATLGLWPFQDQERVLGRLLRRRAVVAGERAPKRRRLENPLAAAIGLPSSASSSSSSSANDG